MASNPSPGLASFVPDDQQQQSRFGEDVVAYPSLDPSFAKLTGVNTVAERLYRRFNTRAGFLTFHPGDGLDVQAFLSKGITDQYLQMLKSLIEAEALKDECVDAAVAVVRFSRLTESLTIELSGTASNNETFSMVVEASKLDVKLISVGT